MTHQQNLFDENHAVLKSEEKVASDKGSSNFKECAEKKKKAPAKKAPKKAPKKKTSKKTVAKKEGVKETGQISNEKNVEAKVDYINGDGESGAKNEI